MNKYAALFALVLFTACANEPANVEVTVDPENQAYPDRKPSPPVSGELPDVFKSTRLPDSAFINPGDPERFIDRSSELVVMGLNSRGALSDLSRALAQDPPSRAELNCNPREALCAEARSMLASRGIHAQLAPVDEDSVTLVYDRTIARDCDSRYIDNSRNGANMHHPALGCSVAGNTLQMVSDKRQFTNPSLMDLPDGAKAVQAYRRYRQPPPPRQTEGASPSLLNNIRVR
jgi:hypothetical protein